jgi:hypothetical protein
MPPTITFITSHALTGLESQSNREAQERFAEYVDVHRPPLLDFQAYLSDDRSELKLFFVFPDVGAQVDPAHREQRATGFRESRLAGLLAGAVIVMLFFVAVYAGSTGVPPAV